MRPVTLYESLCPRAMESEDGAARGDNTNHEGIVGLETISSDESDHGEESDAEDDAEKKKVTSLLDKLKPAKMSELARARKTKTNKPPNGVRRSRGSSAANPKNVTPSQRIREFKDEPFSVSAGRLFCSGCREVLGLKKSVITYHINSAKHQDRKKAMAKEKVHQGNIATSLKEYNESHHFVGETLPVDHQVYRVKVVETFIASGVPLNKLDSFKPLLEENAMRLTDVQHMSDLIPFIHGQEMERIRADIASRPVSVTFDGTTRFGEALAIVLRYVTDDFKVQQKLVKAQMLAKSMTGQEIARELISVLSVSYGVASGHLLGAMRDRASTNNVAMETVRVIYPSFVDIGCFSHTKDHVGDKFHTPVLTPFASKWINLFSHSPKS